jgi:hypothetical protein
MPPARWSRGSSGAWPTRHPERFPVRLRLRRSGVMAILLAALLGSLWGIVGSPGDVAAAAPGCQPGRHVVCVGRGDGGHVVHVALGQAVMVELGGSGLRWSGLRQLNPRLLQQHGTTKVRRGALSATYVAKVAGRTGLRASGAPTCARGTACPQFIVLWQVRIVVARRK